MKNWTREQVSSKSIDKHDFELPVERESVLKGSPNSSKEERNKFEVEGDDRGRKHRYVTSLPVKYENINVSGDVTKIEVVLEEAPDETVLAGSIPSELNASIEFNSTYPGGIPETGTVVVRAEEALIVILVLFLWVAAIALFFNRWGKIRMLEPYQPKFQQQHRQSCTMVDMNAIPDHPVHQGSCVTSTTECWRPRQNSVFVGSSSGGASLVAVDQETSPRRAKSAFDLQSLVLAECNVSSSLETTNPQPTSFSLETSKLAQRRTSVCQLLDKPLQQRQRGMSVCHVDRGDYQILHSQTSQRDRGMSICYFDRTDVLARPLQRDHHRGSSICHFDRMDVLARPRFGAAAGGGGTSVSQFDRMDVLARPTSSYLGKSLLRERRVSVCNFAERNEEGMGGVRSSYPYVTPTRLPPSSVNNLDKIEPPREDPPSDQNNQDNGIAYYFDRPSCSKTPDVVLGYKATCV
ncbi:uncharacterized protein LOC122518429 [Polistes fuscatus]|uniref:uncharacterized protein LOC122518429 n=1 Tax=Polistes fuscatus TaxID=30207 RepID=UPI001CA9D8C3|nr:uncharacterized protein LOC122518429 [Polistes fuscatus]